MYVINILSKQLFVQSLYSHCAHKMYIISMKMEFACGGKMFNYLILQACMIIILFMVMLPPVGIHICC